MSKDAVGPQPIGGKLSPWSRRARRLLNTADEDKNSSFLVNNESVAVPTTAIFTEPEITSFCKDLTSVHKSMESLTSADHPELVTEVLRVVCALGGEERAYTRESSFDISVSGNKFKLASHLIPEVVAKQGHVVRGLAFTFPETVKAILTSPAYKQYFADFFGPEANPLLIRADLFHGRYAHKYDQELVKTVRRENLAIEDG
jgi:hypothetical protein